MSLRKILEIIGLIESEDHILAANEAVRMAAEEINDEARREIHDSRERRALLQLRLERIKHQNR